jgi:1-acyl-sn-glycerol-3-phosphate acyltransferase
LGPDWKPEWTGAPTYVANHRSWLDIMIGYSIFNANFVSKIAVRSIPGIGRGADFIGCIYVKRIGNDAAASRARVFE